MVDTRVSFEITRDDGQVFIIDDSVWRIPNDGLDGWHNLDVDIGTLDSVTNDGGFITNQHVGMVYRTITSELRDIQANQVGRRQAESFFMPKRTYTVKATYMGRTRKCEGVQSKFTLSQGNVHLPVTFVWTILCADPYMTSENPVTGRDSFGSEPRFGFPYVSLAKSQDGYNRGFITGTSNTSSNEIVAETTNKIVKIVTNDGDMPVAPKFVVKLKEIQQTDKINLKIMKLHSTFENGVKRWTNSGTYIDIKQLNYYAYSLYGLVYYEIVVDMGKRPFAPRYGNSRMQFELGYDSMLRIPNAEVGESVYSLEVKDTTGEYVPVEEISFDVVLEPKFTGV